MIKINRPDDDINTFYCYLEDNNKMFFFVDLDKNIYWQGYSYIVTADSEDDARSKVMFSILSGDLHISDRV